MRLPLLLLTACALSLWTLTPWTTAGAAPTVTGPVQPGQVWTLEGVTAEGEQFRTSLKLSGGEPDLQNATATYRADRGALLLDREHASLVALDLADAQGGGLALACAYIGPLKGTVYEGVLAATTLGALPARLEAALAVASVTSTPQERAEAAAELRLGSCTLRLMEGN